MSKISGQLLISGQLWNFRTTGSSVYSTVATSCCRECFCCHFSNCTSPSASRVQFSTSLVWRTVKWSLLLTKIPRHRSSKCRTTASSPTCSRWIHCYCYPAVCL